MKKRILAAGLAAAVFATSLTACGSSSKSGSEKKSGKTYKIGVCQLVQHPALDAATKGFKEELEKKLGGNVKIDVQNASGDSATCATICNGFVTSGDDLIMANATASLQAASSATSKIPVVGTSITDYASALNISDWKGTTGKNVTGTSDLAPLDKQADMFSELLPDAKKIGILYCSAESNSKYQANVVKKALEKKGLTVKAYTFSDSNDVSTVTKSACQNEDALYIPTDNTAASCSENIKNVVVPAKIPVIAGEEGIAKSCGVATLSIDYYELGKETGDMAYDILVNGKDPSKMEIKTAPSVTKEYNKEISDTLGIKIPSDYKEIKAD